MQFRAVSEWTVALVFIGNFVIQASASTVPLGQRNSDATSYQGPGTLIKDLSENTMAAKVARGTNSSYAIPFDANKAQQLLGGDSVVDCHSNTATEWENAIDALTTLVNSIGESPMTLQPGICTHRDSAQTLAQICNRSDSDIEITRQQAQMAFDILKDTCTSKKASGTIQTASGVRYAIYAKVGVGGGAGNRKREPGQLMRRCINPSDGAITGCEDNVCKPKIELNASGDCPYQVGNGETDGCSQYCEARAAKYYGVPQIYEDLDFCPGTDCTLERGKSVTIEKSVSFGFGLDGSLPGKALEAVLGLGISFGISFATSTSIAQGNSFGPDKCGWWYKVPVMLHSCGTFSEYDPNFTVPDSTVFVCLKDAPLKKTSHDVCSEVPAAKINSDEPEVIVIPKWVDCNTRKDLPDDQNSPAWKNIFADKKNAAHTC